MAKKKTTRTTRVRTVSEKGWLVRACAYFALIIAAFLFLFGGLGIFEGRIKGVLNLIGQIALVIGIGFPAYDFTRGRAQAWKWIFWIAFIVYVFGCVFGLIRGF